MEEEKQEKRKRLKGREDLQKITAQHMSKNNETFFLHALLKLREVDNI